MKDSGLEWIGEIPSKWEIVSIKRVLRKADYGISDNLYGEGDIPVLRMGNISNGVIDLTDLRFIDNVDKSLYLTPGDLLYNRTNSLAMIAKVGLFVGSDKYDKISFASYLVRLRPNNRTTSKFLSYLLNVSGVIDEARAIAYPSINQVNLSPTRYLTIKIPLPPLTEQETIVDQLIRVDHQTNQMSDLIRKSLALLQEYRSSLITAAVSGQIDVSKMRAKAPE
jgi:type I restriction enzyme S subunit